MIILLKYGSQERFVRLMTRAARQADVMVPVIAGPTILQSKSWTKHIIRPEWSTKIASVIITKRDLVSNTARLQIPAIAKMCEIPDRYDSILVCDTPQGMAAMQLQLRLDEIDCKYADDPILPNATAQTDHRLGQEIKGIIPELIDEAGSLYRVSPRKRQRC
jgi:hypothetical protein